MRFGEQIRAIRAITSMTREAFSERAGISIDTLDNVEKGGTYQNKTGNRLTRLVNSLGYQLTENGILETSRAIIWLESYLDLLAEIRAAKPGFALFMNADDRKSSEAVNAMMAEISAVTPCRFLSPPECDLFVLSKDLYRTSEHVVSRDVSVIYDGSVGIFTADGVMLVSNRWIAEDYRRQFEYFWGIGRHV